MSASVLLLIASTNPSPSTLTDARCAVTFVCAGIVSSWSDGGMARSWMRDPPGCSRNTDAIEEARSLLHDLTGAAEDRHQMALAAAARH